MALTEAAAHLMGKRWHWLTDSGRGGPSDATGFSKFSNEVQPQIMVLPWQRTISTVTASNAVLCPPIGREIAAVLGRAPFTISRKVSRNESAISGCRIY